jgi:signal transduction histidine kinase
MKQNILLVEDEKDQRKILAEELKAIGFFVASAKDGLEALKKIEKGSFDLVITDIKMPKMDGLKLCKQIRASYPDIQILVMTGSVDLEQAIELLNLRVSGLIRKPFSIEELSDKITNSVYSSIFKEVLSKYSKMAKLGELTASIAHELRNATMSSSLAVNLLINNNAIKMDKKLSSYVDTVKNGVIRLDTTINHLLGYSKSTDHHRLINLKGFFETLIVLNTDRIRVYGITVKSLTKDVSINAVEDSLQIIFLNLIENALHAMEDKGILKITAAQNKINTVINIADNGKGISEGDKTKIFVAFYTTKAEKGTGLGLSLVKREVIRLGGSISFKSIEGKETTFTVTIPN